MKTYKSVEDVKIEDFKKTEVICIDGTLKVVKNGKIEDFKVVAK